MTVYKVEAFKHTGFSPNNIPDSAATLRALFPDISVYPSVNLLQDRGVPSIQIESTWEAAKNIDYVCLGDVNYYIVVEHIMVNPKVTRLVLSMDYLTTLGLGNLEIVSGWCTRRHVTDDRLFSNVLDEPYAPQQALELDMGEIIVPSGEGYTNLVCSTVDLSKLDFEADAYESAVGQLTVVVPKLPPSSTETEIQMNTNGGHQYKFTMPQTALYDIDNPTVQEKTQSLRSLGVEASITAAYKIPNGYCIPVMGADGKLDRITSLVYNPTLDSIPYIYPTQVSVKNNKVFSGQFHKIRLYSVVSGDAAEYRVDEVYLPGATNFQVTLFADPQPTGKPYCRPYAYRKNTDDVFIEAVSGAQWQNYQMVYNERSGQAFADLENGRRKFEQVMSVVDYAASMPGRFALGALAGPAGVAGAVAGAVSDGGRLLANVHNQEQDYQNAKNVVVPDIRFPLSNTLQNYLSNAFWAIRVRLSESDTIRFDAFLTQFGYAVSEPLKDEHFRGRVHFNYVKANGVNLKMKQGKPFDMMSRLGAIAQIEAGVRVWHTAPDIAAMYDNPIA